MTYFFDESVLAFILDWKSGKFSNDQGEQARLKKLNRKVKHEVISNTILENTLVATALTTPSSLLETTPHLVTLSNVSNASNGSNGHPHPCYSVTPVTLVTIATMVARCSSDNYRG